MITICQMDDIEYEKFDEVWAIVRSMKNHNPRVKQETTLSPSTSLFQLFQFYKKAWEWDKEHFDKIFVPKFLEEMTAPEARERLNYLYKADKENKSICLACYCVTEEMCHRSIVAGLLQGAGCNVTGVKKNYSNYYDIYKKKIKF